MRQLGIIEDGAILISDGIITNVGPTRRIENLAEARSAEEINAAGRVVMPGLSTPTLISSLRRRDWRKAGLPARWRSFRPGPQCNPFQSIEHIRRTSAPSLEHQAKRLLSGFLRHGTTTIEAKSGYGLDESGEMKMLRVHLPAGRGRFPCCSDVPCSSYAASGFAGTRMNIWHGFADIFFRR